MQSHKNKDDLSIVLDIQEISPLIKKDNKNKEEDVSLKFDKDILAIEELFTKLFQIIFNKYEVEMQEELKKSCSVNSSDSNQNQLLSDKDIKKIQSSSFKKVFHELLELRTLNHFTNKNILSKYTNIKNMIGTYHPLLFKFSNQSTFHILTGSCILAFLFLSAAVTVTAIQSGILSRNNSNPYIPPHRISYNSNFDYSMDDSNNVTNNVWKNPVNVGLMSGSAGLIGFLFLLCIFQCVSPNIKNYFSEKGSTQRKEFKGKLLTMSLFNSSTHYLASQPLLETKKPRL